ncbi:hypothetical protein B0H16DRAFT_1504292 [Mycena metata]|uniref:F-box domain-containing protein n=1 Tax=Mycena metata TaxID=1033252 RepID=A0AAD7NVW0_9AGAR|nr:hypothetical protein B0H16DRAFT_1504292 [Mycena metata]
MNSKQCPQCGAVEKGDDILVSDLYAPPGSRYGALLNSNDSPLDSDVVVIESSISRTDARLVSINGEMARLNKRLKLLEEEQLSLSISRTQSRSILSPLRKIPPEILAEIFLWTLPSDKVAVEDGIHITDSPWLLTHIRRQWKQVCISTPSMWSLVVMAYHPKMKLSSLCPVWMLETQIARARRLKIHFFGFETTDAQSQTEMFQYLAKHASMWEEVNLQLTPTLSALLPDLKNRIPSLRSLWLWWENEESVTVAQSMDFLESASSLVDLAIINNEHRRILITSLFPAHQLTCYELECPWGIHLSILRLARNLVEARVWIRFDDTLWATSGEIVELPYLRRLYISAIKALEYFRVPALEELAFNFKPSVVPFVVGVIQSLLARSSCTLRCLCICSCPDVPTFITLLQNIPSILTLRIIPASVVNVNTLLIGLSVFVGATVVAPQLSCISLGFMAEGGPTPADYRVYAQMLASRWTSGFCALRSASLLLEPGTLECDATSLVELQKLREEGLDFDYVHGEDALPIIDRWVYSHPIYIP